MVVVVEGHLLNCLTTAMLLFIELSSNMMEDRFMLFRSLTNTPVDKITHGVTMEVMEEDVL